ncbi:hypothetical protein MP228_010376 [Amoeboaphelidium protococcarum]|nr:hypothetical protein MP228_010376 [Amoeboaphelidium protococcarum]
MQQRPPPQQPQQFPQGQFRPQMDQRPPPNGQQFRPPLPQQQHQGQQQMRPAMPQQNGNMAGQLANGMQQMQLNGSPQMMRPSVNRVSPAGSTSSSRRVYPGQQQQPSPSMPPVSSTGPGTPPNGFSNQMSPNMQRQPQMQFPQLQQSLQQQPQYPQQRAPMQPPPLQQFQQPQPGPPMQSQQQQQQQFPQQQPQFQQQQPMPPQFPPQPLQQSQSQFMEQQRQKINPDQIPSVVEVQRQDQELWDNHEYRTNSKQLPPLASTDFLCVDDGNAAPRFIRATTYNVPGTSEVSNLSKIPFGLVIQPMAHMPSNEPPVPVVDMGPQGPVRCNRCKAYVNPFMRFVDGGRKLYCNICEFGNTEVPAEYFSALDMGGLGLDHYQRPELQYGTVDFVATPEFCFRKPVPASFVFMIDVSFNAIQSGMMQLAVDTLLEILDLFPENDEGEVLCKIGIVAFDRAVHFFNLNSQKLNPELMTMNDLEDGFVPIEDGFLVNPVECREQIESVLKQFPKLFSSARTPETCFGSAVDAVLSGLAKTGGRIVVLQSSLPNFGSGSLTSREDPKLFNTDKEKTLFAPQNDFYVKLAEKAVGCGVGVDLFLFPQQYIDVATIGPLSSISGGNTYMYVNFNYARDGYRFAEELRRIVTRQFGYDCILRVRCGNGLRAVEHHGNFMMRNTTDVEMGVVDSEKSIAIKFVHDGKIDENADISFQIAMLYTSALGQRLIRVINLTLPSTTVLANVFRNADMDTTLNLVIKSAVAQCQSTQLKVVREQLSDLCVQILGAYRKHCASSGAAGQLILPETYKLYPILSLAMLKFKALRGGVDLSSDFRVHGMRYVRNIGVGASTALFYPRIFAIHDLQEGVCEYDPQLNHFVLPHVVRASIDYISPNGVYLLENTEVLYMYVTRNVDNQFCQDVFGQPGVEQIDIKLRELPVIDNVTSVRVRALISHIQDDMRRGQYVQLQIIRQGDPMEPLFMQLLVEDKNNDNMNYIDYLCLIHANIRQQILDS